MAAEKNISLSEADDTTVIRLGLPKGHMQENITKLLSDGGIHVNINKVRGYRASINLNNYHVKLLKPQNILEMLHIGSRDIGFGGSDWAQNLGVDVVELLDTKLDPVRLVVAAPSENILEDAKASGKQLVIASEYETLTNEWIKKKGINAKFVRAFGATESFPPEDADLIVDNTATGSTLEANGLKIIDTILHSSTRLYAHKGVMDDPKKRKRIEEFVLVLTSVLHGREHQMVEFNLNGAVYDQVIGSIPALRAPTVSKLHSDGYAVKIVAKKNTLPELLPRLKSLGATEIIVSDIRQMIL